MTAARYSTLEIVELLVALGANIHAEKKNNKENVSIEIKNEPITITETTTKQLKKLSYKEQKELEQIEQEIEKLEIEKKQFAEELSSGLLSQNELFTKGQQLQLIEEKLENKSLRWLELQEKLES